MNYIGQGWGIDYLMWFYEPTSEAEEGGRESTFWVVSEPSGPIAQGGRETVERCAASSWENRSH